MTGDKNLKHISLMLIILLIAGACACEAKIFQKSGKSFLKIPKKSQKEDIFKRPALEKRQNNYLEIKDDLKLSEKELNTFNEIYVAETWALRPLALELETKYLRMDELNERKCKWYQKTCKKELKNDKKFLEDDITELKRQIWQKKEYYKILYLNATTKEQDLKLRKMINVKTNSKPQMW